MKQALEENGQDVDAAIAYILQLLSIEGIDGRLKYGFTNYFLMLQMLMIPKSSIG